MTAAATAARVIRISPMAHFASGFLACALLVMVPVWGNRALALLVIPVLLSVAIERLRTVADADGVTARGLLSSTRLPWAQVEGLRFSRGGWARACRPDGHDVVLPAVTFATVPQLTEASGGRVPNPYAPATRESSAGERIGAVEEHPGGHAAADTEDKRQE